jgi:glucose-1-phosphate cytidylyltransferase
MKAVILAGGFGTRISEESRLKPKPMVEIGGKPIIWHIMKHLFHFGIKDFIVCAGYKQEVIKEYFANYFIYNSDVTFDFSTANSMSILHEDAEPWRVSVVDTGLNTMTGGRVKRIERYVDDKPFLLTYGDGVSDIDIDKLIDFHKKRSNTVTISAYNLDQRFGVLDVDDEGSVKAMREKSRTDSSLINIGYMICEHGIFDLIKGDDTVLEADTLPELVKRGKLGAYRHDGFWQCMDTLREKNKLEKLWASGEAPWKVW